MKKIIRFSAVICVLALLMAAIYGVLNREEAAEVYSYKETTVMKGEVVSGVTESGSVSIETVEQAYELDFLSASQSGGLAVNANQGASSDDEADDYLEVEEVYISEGMIVSEGTPVLKLTSDSVEAVRANLQKAVDDAQDELNNAEFDDEKTLMTAKHEYENNLASGETAQWVYENIIKKLEKSVSDINEKIEDINEKIEVY